MTENELIEIFTEIKRGHDANIIRYSTLVDKNVLRVADDGKTYQDMLDREVEACENMQRQINTIRARV
ncbi:hypothetical protein [Sphingobium yanoikuyae]|uniref:hypothetical protein n=1 Tax=Sphingobium yanoikuyae TaxID=13690 RepID=UPI0035B40DA5